MRVAKLGFGVLLVLAALLAPISAQAAVSPLMVTVGDSVPAGAQCGCIPFPLRYAGAVARRTGQPTRMVDNALSGATSATVLRQVRGWGAGSAAASSRVALVMVGANDFGPAFERVLDGQQSVPAAYGPAAASVRANVTAIIRRLQQLRPGVRVVVLDYWNVVKDGAVGRQEYGAWGAYKAAQATAYANNALHQAATATGAYFVSTVTALKGARGTGDPTRFLGEDGDHPNVAGHIAISGAVYRVLPNG